MRGSCSALGDPGLIFFVLVLQSPDKLFLLLDDLVASAGVFMDVNP